MSAKRRAVFQGRECRADQETVLVLTKLTFHMVGKEIRCI